MRLGRWPAVMAGCCGRSLSLSSAPLPLRGPSSPPRRVFEARPNLVVRPRRWAAAPPGPRGWRAFPRPPVARSCQAVLLTAAAGVAAAVWLRNSQLEIDCPSRAALRM